MLTSAEDMQRIRARVLHTIQYGLEFDLTTEEGKHLLKRHVNSNVTIVVLFIGINGSTQMSITLPPPKFATLVQVFSQEARLAIMGHGGYVLKYVGNSVIGLFLAEFDKKKARENTLNCAKSNLSVIRECINPVLKNHSLPDIPMKVGLECGLSLVILYGKNIDVAPIDLIGPSISIASKITSAAQPNQIFVGESVYGIFASDTACSNKFYNIKLPNDEWNCVDKASGNIYELYSYE